MPRATIHLIFRGSFPPLGGGVCVCACLPSCLCSDHKYIWIKIARNIAQSSSSSSFLHFLKQDLTMMPVVMGAAAQKQ